MPYQRVTLVTLRGLLKARWEGQPFWSDEDALDVLNEALQVWNLLTGFWKTRVLLATLSGATDYTLPATMVYGMRVEWNGRPLSPSSREDLNLGRYRWRSETTISGGDVPTRPLLWVPVGLTQVRIWPADDASGNSLTFDGVAATPVLVGDDDYVDLGDETLTLLLDYALHAASFKKGGTFFSATGALFQRFLQGAAEENAQIKASQVFRRFAGLPHVDQQQQTGAPTLLDNVGKIPTDDWRRTF